MSKTTEKSTISFRIDFQKDLNEAIDAHSEVIGFKLKQADFIRLSITEMIKKVLGR